MGRRPRYDTQMDGVLVVDKPVGASSAEVVRRVRFAAGNCKTGHAGTLDPLASGVLVCLLGEATRLTDQMMGMVKVYEAAADLSAFTTTDDREGPREEVSVDRPPSEADLAQAASQFVGEIEQIPPAYSAVHIGGQRAYRLARQGQEVRLGARRVRIDAIDILGYAWPIAQLRIRCGKGTYIRSVARDLGRALGTGGHLAALRRTAVGPFLVDEAVGLREVAKMNAEQVRGILRSPASVTGERGVSGNL